MIVKDISQLDEELEKFYIKAIVESEKALKEVLEVAAKSIAFNSPVVTGHYINNHEMILGSVGKGGVPAVKKTKGKVSASSAKAKMLSKFMGIIGRVTKKNKLITISNVVPYAINVEAIGWGKKPPYAVYQKAIQAMSTSLLKEQTEFNNKEYKG